MSRWQVVLVVLAVIVLATPGGPAAAAGQQRDQAQQHKQLKLRVQPDEPCYGWQLMSDEERNRYREQLMKLKTEQEKEQFRNQHREEMRQRAKALGQELPEPSKQ